MRSRATENGPEDGWRGARIGAERRDRLRRDATAMGAEVDLGEPRVPAVTSVVLAVVLAVTLWEFQRYGSTPTATELARAGGASLGALASGEWWKLLVANLLHGSVTHLGLNIFFSFLVGRQLEHLAGRTVVVATVLWSTLLSSVGVLAWGGGAVSIGESGILFGLMGCAFVLDPRGRTAVGLIMRPLLIVNVIYTFVAPNVSVGGHLGGLLAGVLVGCACWRRAATDAHPVGRPRQLATAVVLATALPLVAVCSLGVERIPGKARELRSDLVAPLLEREIGGAELTNGRTLGSARCRGTGDPLRYRCSIEGDGVDGESTVTFEPGPDTWSLPVPAGG